MNGGSAWSRMGWPTRTALVLLFLMVWLYWRSDRHADALIVFGPEGRVQGLMACARRLILFVSNVPVDGRAWRVTLASSERDIGITFWGQLSSAASFKRRFGAFAWERQPVDAFGLPGRWGSVVGRGAGQRSVSGEVGASGGPAPLATGRR